MDAPAIESRVRRAAQSSPQPTDWGTVWWASRAGDPDDAEMTVGIAVFDAGKGNAEHIHPECEEVVYVLEGEVEHTLGDQSTRLRRGDMIVVPRGIAHRLEAAGEGAARALILFSSPDRQFVPTGR